MSFNRYPLECLSECLSRASYLIGEVPDTDLIVAT